MPAWLLKAGATALTLLTALASAQYVGSHVKTPAGPLHPSVVHVPAGVRTSDTQPITTTYAS